MRAQRLLYTRPAIIVDGELSKVRSMTVGAATLGDGATLEEPIFRCASELFHNDATLKKSAARIVGYDA